MKGTSEVVSMIRNAVIARPKPAVYISGGLDSSIILHHVVEKCSEKVRTYTASFGFDGDETRFATMLAEYYGTVHTIVDVSDFIPRLPEILKGFANPRFNVWAYLLAERAKKDGVKTVYIGEGGDEHFGGYALDERGYLDAWGNHFEYIVSTYENIHKRFGLDLEIPFDRLDWKQTLKYYAPPTKVVLKIVYRGLIPDFVLDRKKTPPAYTNYWQLWKNVISKYFPDYQPKTIADIRKALNYLATRAWLESNNDFGEVK